jgi:hypothetical protein
MNLGGTIFTVHTDDTLIIGRTQDAIKQAHRELTNATHRIGLADNKQIQLNPMEKGDERKQTNYRFMPPGWREYRIFKYLVVL